MVLHARKFIKTEAVDCSDSQDDNKQSYKTNIKQYSKSKFYDCRVSIQDSLKLHEMKTEEHVIDFSEGKVVDNVNVEQCSVKTEREIKTESDDSNDSDQGNLKQFQNAITRDIKNEFDDRRVLHKSNTEQRQGSSEKLRRGIVYDCTVSCKENIGHYASKTENWDHGIFVNIRKKIKQIYYE